MTIEHIHSFLRGHHALDVVEELDLQTFVRDAENCRMGDHPDFRVLKRCDDREVRLDECLLGSQSDALAFGVHDEHLW